LAKGAARAGVRGGCIAAHASIAPAWEMKRRREISILLQRSFMVFLGASRTQHEGIRKINVHAANHQRIAIVILNISFDRWIDCRS
jgi:hypothetical protein